MLSVFYINVFASQEGCQALLLSPKYSWTHPPFFFYLFSFQEGICQVILKEKQVKIQADRGLCNNLEELQFTAETFKSLPAKWDYRNKIGQFPVGAGEISVQVIAPVSPKSAPEPGLMKRIKCNGLVHVPWKWNTHFG